MEIEGDSVRMVATDGFKLALRNYKLENSYENRKNRYDFFLHIK